jgi:hypothetical protein
MECVMAFVPDDGKSTNDCERFQWVDEFTLKSQLRGALEKLSFEG